MFTNNGDLEDKDTIFVLQAAGSAISVNPDVIIDFSHPSTLDELLDYCITNRVALVIATTGYSQNQVYTI